MVKPKIKSWLAENFAAKLKHLRKNAGYTAHAFAQKVGISKGYLSELENGRGSPSFATLELLAEGLKTHPTELLYSVDEDICRDCKCCWTLSRM